MRAFKPEENHIDIIKKLNSYVSSEENMSTNFINSTGNIMKELDLMEKYINSVPDDKYKQDLLNNIVMMRQSLIQSIDIIDEMNNG